MKRLYAGFCHPFDPCELLAKAPIRFVVIFVVLLFGVSGLLGQSGRVLRGTMVYLNSGRQPAIGVAVAGTVRSIEHATPTHTDARGDYQLQFPKARPGWRVALTIGSEDQAGQAIEVVNRSELEQCVLPNRQDAVFKIVVCPKGARDLAAERYYNIILKSTDAALQRKKEQINRLLQRRERDYASIGYLSQELAHLQQQVDSVAIYREAWRLASINKDEASERTLEYLRRIEAGETIQDARQALDIEAATQQLQEELAKVQSAIEELNTRVRASTTLSDYQDALACLDSTVIHLEAYQELISPLLVADYHHRTAQLYEQLEAYDQAIVYGTKAVKLWQQYHQDSLLAEGYHHLSRWHLAIGAIAEGLAYSQEALIIFEGQYSCDHPHLVQLYHTLAMAHRHQHRYADALRYTQQACALAKRLYSDHQLEQMDVCGQAAFEAGEVQNLERQVDYLSGYPRLEPLKP